MLDPDRLSLAAEIKRAFQSARAASVGSEKPNIQPDRVPPTSFLAAATGEIRGAPSNARRAKPISFTLPLLRAVLAGRKTQTRRPVRPVPGRVVDGVPTNGAGGPIAPPAVAGDRLWVREKWGRVVEDGVERFAYAVDEPATRARWMASRFMPRAASRHALAVAGVRLVRLAAIDDADALREGVDATDGATPRAAFFALWDSIYGDTEFAAANDPWVWAIEFAMGDAAPAATS